MPQFVPHIPITTNAKVITDLSGGMNHGLRDGMTVRAYELRANGKLVMVYCSEPGVMLRQVMLKLESCEVPQPTYSDRRAQNGLYELYCAKHGIDMSSDAKTNGQLSNTPAPTTELTELLTTNTRTADIPAHETTKKTDPKRLNGKHDNSRKPPPGRGNQTRDSARP